MSSLRKLASIFLVSLLISSFSAHAGPDYPAGCLCKDAFKQKTIELTDSTPPYNKRKIKKVERVKGLLHCNCGKQECVIAAPIERTEIHMSCTDR